MPTIEFNHVPTVSREVTCGLCDKPIEKNQLFFPIYEMGKKEVVPMYPPRAGVTTTFHYRSMYAHLECALNF